MDVMAKNTFKAQIAQLSAGNMMFKSLMAMPVGTAIAGMYPVNLHPALAPHLQALKTHADEFDKLLKLLDDIIAKS